MMHKIFWKNLVHNMKKVLITCLAKEDIIEIKNYMNNPNAYGNFINSLSKVFEMLRDFPNVGIKKQGIKNSSVLIYTINKKYNIAYRINNENIEILRVLNKYQKLFAVL